MENNIEIHDEEAVGLKSIVVGYIRQWKLFVAVGFVSLILAIIYLVVIPSTYDIMARIQVQESEAGGGSFGLGEAAGLMKSFGLGGGGGASISIDDEMAILGSNELLRKVIYELGLQVEYLKPGKYKYKMYQNSPIKLTVDASVSQKLLDEYKLKLSIAKNGKVKVIAKGKNAGGQHVFESESLPMTLSLPEGNIFLEETEYKQVENKPYKMTIKLKPASWVAEDLMEDILIEDISKASNIIELSYQDYETRRGADLLNMLIQKYNEQFYNIKQQEALQSMSFIEGRIQNVIDELAITEKNIESFKEKNKMTDLEYDLQFYVLQMQELQAKIVEVESEKMVVEMMNTFVKDPANKYKAVPMLLSASEGENGGTISLYNQKLLELIGMKSSSKTENPLLKQSDEQLDKMREGVEQTIFNAKNGLDQVLAELKAKENLLFSKMGEVPAMEREYVNYRRQQEIYQGVYLVLLQKRENTALTLGELRERAHIVDPAYVKQKRVAPRKLYAALFMMVFTLIIPVVLIETRRLYVDLKKEFRKGV